MSSSVPSVSCGKIKALRYQPVRCTQRVRAEGWTRIRYSTSKRWALALGAISIEIAPSARAHRLLVEYLMRVQPSARTRCVQRTGWYRNAFILPQATLGTLDDIVLYQTHHPTPAYTQAGSLEDWQ